MANEIVLSRKDLIENPTPRVPVMLCLDTSASMTGDPIMELAKGVTLFYESIFDDEIARYSAEIGIVTFGYGGVQQVADFGPAERKPALEIQAGGHTPMGEAVCKALNLLEARKQEYQDAGVDYFQPWLVLMTDGMPNDENRYYIDEAIRRIGDLVRQKKLSVFPIGIGSEADMDTLGLFSPERSPLRLRELKFKEFFEWLSASVQQVSASIPGQDIPLNEEGIKGWGTV